jgi:hypothetical protein
MTTKIYVLMEGEKMHTGFFSEFSAIRRKQSMEREGWEDLDIVPLNMGDSEGFIISAEERGRIQSLVIQDIARELNIPDKLYQQYLLRPYELLGMCIVSIRGIMGANAKLKKDIARILVEKDSISQEKFGFSKRSGCDGRRASEN